MKSILRDYIGLGSEPPIATYRINTKFKETKIGVIVTPDVTPKNKRPSTISAKPLIYMAHRGGFEPPTP